MLHLTSEPDFDFNFSLEGESFLIKKTKTKLTSHAGLAAFAAFLKKMKIVEHLVETCPVQRTSHNATPVKDIIIGFLLSVLTGGTRFRDIVTIQNDAVLGELFGVERRIPGDDTVRRFFSQFSHEELRKWISGGFFWLYQELNIPYILDWDSTVITRFGDQEDAEIGYNPTKPGRKSHHPLVASIAGSRFCLPLFQRAGNTSSSNNWIEAMEYLLSELSFEHKPFINRGDIGFGTEKIMSWHEESNSRPNYLFKLRKTKRVHELIAKIGDEIWNGANTVKAMRVIDTEVQLNGWSRPRRVVVGRRLISELTPEESGNLFGECHYEYHVYITNLTPTQLEFWQVVDLYNQRADCENIFDELKNEWGLGGYCSSKGEVTELAAQFNILAYDLWNLYTRFFTGRKYKEGKRSRREYMNLIAKWTKSARQNVLQMSIPDRLLEPLRNGYVLLMKWLNRTAPQLRLIELVSEAVPENLLLYWKNQRPILQPNCGI
jgi:hypothetical protein